MTKKRVAIVLFAFLFLMFGVSALFAAIPMRAQAAPDDVPEETVQPNGLFTNVSVSITGKNSRVYGTACHEFTLFETKVEIKIYLYSSANPLTSYRGMRLDGTAYTGNLAVYDTLTVDAPTKGETRYWCARILFTIDNGEQEELCTDVVHIDGAGNLIND